MKTVSELSNEIDEVKQKINSLSIEKTEKVEEIEKLKASNVQLLINAADKTRKPMSISSQTNRITTLQVEIEQLQGAIEVLTDQETVLQNELFVAELKAELDAGYFTLKGPYLAKVHEIKDGLKAMVDYGKALTEMITEFNKTPNPLMAGNLYNIFKRCKTLDQFRALGLDWAEESSRFKICDAIMADERTLDKLANEIGKLSGMLLSLEQSFIPSIGAAIPHA